MTNLTTLSRNRAIAFTTAQKTHEFVTSLNGLIREEKDGWERVHKYEVLIQRFLALSIEELLEQAEACKNKSDRVYIYELVASLKERLPFR